MGRPREIQISVGARFGTLTFLREIEPLKGSSRRCEVQCDCGTTKTIQLAHLRRGTIKSCGCLRREVTSLRMRTAHHTKHGHARNGKKSPEYYSWRAMIGRCQNPKDVEFFRYGNRGITVCARWQGEHGFENFLVDLGPRPEGTTLDRNESNGNYEPDNCRWATCGIQSHNQSKTNLRTTSKFRGVHFDKSKRKFAVSIGINNKCVYLGRFTCEEQAARVYDEAAKQYYGECAALNFPESIAA